MAVYSAGEENTGKTSSAGRLAERLVNRVRTLEWPPITLRQLTPM